MAQKPLRKSSAVARARCLCGAVRLEIDYPAFWAWHDHSDASRRAHASACATYVGSWKSRFRVVKGAGSIRRFADNVAGATRSFCATCGTPLTYERVHVPKWVNIPRAIFETRTGREPRYHLHIEEAPEWAYRGEPLSPLKGYPGVMWVRPGRKTRPAAPDTVPIEQLPI
ncbi:MAG TPA: GFA family protein [Rhizomicrobium sp.]|jgi:hypothetical protein|nr:GFA family protein [Rhizomicrobium sp.]